MCGWGCLSRAADVGKAKAEVAAERIMGRVRGVRVTPHFCRIEDKDPSFYREFNIIVLGLDFARGPQLHQQHRLQLPGCAAPLPLACTWTGWLETGMHMDRLA